ncbi:TetR/AcrR family transcriptional regulator [Streptomyces malaysiensis]|uniref:TetR/AcrR family transcriptional regulator n=1 Tax=Streptomyces malaysiensis subsp. samsunensis TaxID=459658 RepID=A0A9X2M4W9_STRMQ|nr:TetR/AcrR family transcriptional regulator [Streptomyces samsunensis]MCQ8835473.1 TetR/AcrR family transcriptional regulator [Streptomyces samsunensis]
MTEVLLGRRERKKAATREKIARTALRLFLERGYDAVGIREVAAEADVAVTTVFSHFSSKEALVFELDDDFEQRLRRAVTDREPGEELLPRLEREIQALIRHCTADGTAPFWRMIDESPALRDYEKSMRLRHAESLAVAIAADLNLPLDTTSCRIIARFVIDAFSVSREAPEPEAAVAEVFQMIEAAWQVALRSLAPEPRAQSGIG